MLSQFLESLIDMRPDWYLDELRHELLRVKNVNVSNITVQRALRARGFSYKKVSKFFDPNFDFNIDIY